MTIMRSDEMSGYELQSEERKVSGRPSLTVYRLISPMGAALGLSQFETAEYGAAIATFDLMVALHRVRGPEVYRWLRR
jgi:hypothetical protein